MSGDETALSTVASALVKPAADAPSAPSIQVAPNMQSELNVQSAFNAQHILGTQCAPTEQRVLVSAQAFARARELVTRWRWPITLVTVDDEAVLGAGGCESQVDGSDSGGWLDLDAASRLCWQSCCGGRNPGKRRPENLMGSRNAAASKAISKVGALVVDFLCPKLNYRLRHGGGQQELLARAVGIKHHQKNRPLKVVDATAGLGVDAWILAGLGIEVVMIERSPVMALLLADGLVRAGVPVTALFGGGGGDAVGGNTDGGATGEVGGSVGSASAMFAGSHSLKLLFGDAVQFLVPLAESYHTLYLDPMYPVDAGETAARNQRLRAVHAVVGGDFDADRLLQTAVPLYHRIAVKRPCRAPFLSNLTPHWQLTGRSCRFDLYFFNHSS